jgi:CubicO group peptidase (beta-lactamase class C family)
MPDPLAALRPRVLPALILALPFAFASIAQEKGTDQQAHIRRIESQTFEVQFAANEAPQQLSLAKLMEIYRVPALSVSVIQDYKIAWAKAYGVTDVGATTPATTKTLFQAGSISKPVAAAGALFLVEQGKLKLDQDVNLELKTWKVPGNEFTKTEKVTLRRLMSHTAGLTVHGFPGYDGNDAIPSIVQILNGEKPANTAPVRVDMVPGTKERYSGGGVTIEQLMVMDATGKPFPEFMRETVLDRIGMRDSSYEQPLPPSRASQTAGGTRSDGKAIHGRWHIYPEMAAAGLWTTPTDLASFAIEIALSKQGKANHVLSQKMTSEMLTPVLDEAGLGFFMEKDNPGQFGHNGADEGFQALLTMNADTGNGIAVMANSDQGINLAQFLVRRVANEYAWNYKLHPATFSTLLVIMRMRGVDAGLQRYTELKQAGDSTVDEGILNGLGYMLLYDDGLTDGAIKVFERNVKEYPQSGNVYDSLGEAFMKAGKKDQAIANYEKALELDPKSQNAAEKLRQLKAQK